MAKEKEVKKEKESVKEIEIFNKIISCSTDEKIASETHKAIVDIQDLGGKVISIASVPFHFYSAEDHRCIITYAKIKEVKDE